MSTADLAAAMFDYTTGVTTVGSSPVSCGKVKGTSASCMDARVIRLGCSEGFHV